mgnify:CR=1 FL=1
MMLVLAIVEIFSVILQRIFCDSTLKKKKIRRYTDYLVWGGYFAVFNGVTYVLTYLGDGTSNIWLNILLFVCIFFVTAALVLSSAGRALWRSRLRA